MTGNTQVNEAAKVLYNSGILARSEDEVELLKWYRMLSPTAQKIEFARASGMAQALPYAHIALKDEKESYADKPFGYSPEYEFPNDF